MQTMTPDQTTGKRILIVDDEEPIRELLTTALRFTGYQVESAASAVLHAGPQHQRDIRAALREQLFELRLIAVLSTWRGRQLNERVLDFQSVPEDLAGDGVQFAGLNIRDSLTTARAFVETFDVPYPNVIDRDGRLQLLFGATLPPQAIPSTVIIDRQGRVAGRALGKISESGLRGLIEPLLPR